MEKPRRRNDPLVYVRYLDHVLFRNSKPSDYRPCIRETVGWLDYEDDLAIRILWERSVTRLPNQIDDEAFSGLVILKKNILEVRVVDLS
ncbi:MAG: hypothetical protein QXH51_07665 [Candidatus Bathyarchaeia archaeon]